MKKYQYLSKKLYAQIDAWMNATPCPTHPQRRDAWNAGELVPGAVCSILDDVGLGWAIVPVCAHCGNAYYYTTRGKRWCTNCTHYMGKDERI